MQVSLSAHASTDMPLEPVAAEAIELDLPSSPSGLQQSPPCAEVSKESAASPGAQQGTPSDAACTVSATVEPVRRFRGGSAHADGGDGSPVLGAQHDEQGERGGEGLPGGGEGPPGGGGGGSRQPRRVVSLLARGLADQAAAAALPAIDAAALLQPPAAATADGNAAAAAKPKRSAAWLLGLPHITTVRRMGKAEGGP